MKITFLLTLTALTLGANMYLNAKSVTLRLIETSDVHGSFFPYNFITQKPSDGSMARVAWYVDSLRQVYADNLILLDNGDILQGQPTSYFFNYIATDQTNIAADIVNWLGYDAQAIGNHDIEAGHAVYDKWIKELSCPTLAANMINPDGSPYALPYIILEREGIKIAILGMITPAIPNWLEQDLWSGLTFLDIKEASEKWVKIIKEKEKPHLLIGLFHSGLKGGITTGQYSENAALQVASEVDGFDLIFYGHDHAAYCATVTNPSQQTVWLVDPSNNALKVGDAEIDITIDDNGNITEKNIKARLTDVASMPVHQEFMSMFEAQRQAVSNYVNRKIAVLTDPISTRDCFFGSSAFTDLIHNLQLKLTGADISLNAPLTFDTKIDKGDILMSDMFKLYKYENKIYVLRMKGSEIKNLLEMSYALWTNTMNSPDSHIMNLIEYEKDGKTCVRFANPTFNFDSAAGIDYEVDVTKPQGSKVNILRMSDGKPFSEDNWYNVVMNSYRANGGGQLLTLGAGISKARASESNESLLSDCREQPRLCKARASESQEKVPSKREQSENEFSDGRARGNSTIVNLFSVGREQPRLCKEELQDRIVFRSDMDQRFYLTEELMKMGTITPEANNNWLFVPTDWTNEALKRDRQLIFGD